jgi:1-acyl-sn-glycerol-3-phosphate acyltransferase
MAGTWRATQRLLRMLRHTLQAVRVARRGFDQRDADSQQRYVERWAQDFLRHAGIALQVHGQPATHGPVLWVANHQSWLDIPTLHAAHYARFVSKAEIAQWPLVGRLARAAGTLFIQRSARRDTQRTVQAMAQALRGGDRLVVFPEGTVGDGRTLLPFHGNTLQAAIDADAPVQPVALTFIDAHMGLPSYVPCEAYLDEPMLRSLWRTLKTEHLIAVVHYGMPEYAQGRDRRTWAQDLQARVQALRALPVAGAAQPAPAVKP